MRTGPRPELPSPVLADELERSEMYPLLDDPLPVFPNLIDLLADSTLIRQEWADRALCCGSGFDFHPDEGEPPVEALRMCAACPVAAQCLATALIHENACGQRDGWWGGISPDARQAVWDALNPDTSLLPSLEAVEETDPARRALELRSRGYTVAATAAELGCTKRTVYRLLARAAA